MGVPYSSEWETETWNYLLVYPLNDTAHAKSPTHMAMYHWHRYTSYTPAFAGNDEHLFFATPLNGNTATSKNPYTEWANMARPRAHARACARPPARTYARRMPWWGWLLLGRTDGSPVRRRMQAITIQAITIQAITLQAVTIQAITM